MKKLLPATAMLRLTAKFISFGMILLLMCTACGADIDPLDRIKTVGVLRIATDPSFAPFEYVNDEHKLVGYDVDLALHISEALGVEAQFITTGYDALYDALTVNRADIIISALYPDPSRTHDFAYSTPYFNAGDVLIVANNGISSWKSLGGKRIACILGATGHMVALKWQNSISPAPIVITTDNPLTFTDALISGSLDAAIVDHVTALDATQNTPGVHILPEMISEEPYVIASRTEDKALIDAIDDILSQLENNGTLQRLTERWIQNLH